jgi:hypothetical protein
MEKQNKLLHLIKINKKELRRIIKEISKNDLFENHMYRFYSESYKVIHIRDQVIRMIELLKKLAPEGYKLNEKFNEIIAGIEYDKNLDEEDFQNEISKSRQYTEALFHCKFLLENSIKYGRSLRKAPEILPYGWACLISLYNIWA